MYQTDDKNRGVTKTDVCYFFIRQHCECVILIQVYVLIFSKYSRKKVFFNWTVEGKCMRFCLTVMSAMFVCFYLFIYLFLFCFLGGGVGLFLLRFFVYFARLIFFFFFFLVKITLEIRLVRSLQFCFSSAVLS